MKRGSIKTTKKQIVKWGIENIDECGYGVDCEYMHSHCWRCGHERVTERCHVVPFALGGDDIPSNYRLLCFECHSEGPNVEDPNEMDNWIRRTNVGFYDIFWHIRECMSSAIEKTTIHFGQGTSNTSTNEWMHNKFLDNLVENPHLKTIKNKEDALNILRIGGFKCLLR
jgi:hypothetical protein